MRPRTPSLLALAAFAAAIPAAAAAQVITIRTVPVASGDQFRVFPSDRLGMGQVSIALTDTTGDPFSNPAALSRLGGHHLFSAPSAYDITGGNGGAVTLPVGGLFGGGRWHWGGGLALQEVDRGEPTVWWGDPLVDVWPGPAPGPNTLSSRRTTNLYGFGAISRSFGDASRTGRSFGDHRAAGSGSGAVSAIGASVSVAELSAMTGVDLLYTTPPVAQDGLLYDVRLGLTREGAAGDFLEAVLLHRGLDMRHDFVDRVWIQGQPEGPGDPAPWIPRDVERSEEDRTDTWGLHVGYARPLAPEGWTAGGTLTMNYKSHPKIPNYTLMNIPRDPGDSWAYQLGVGFARHAGAATFAVDLVYEPVWTETWADAAIATPTSGGDTIPVGHMTVFNDFRFDNAAIRLGLEGRMDRLELQAGLQVKRYRYTLDQTDFVAELERKQREAWMEWTPSVALGLRFDDFALHYTGRITAGTGRPGVAWGGVAVPESFASDFLPAPSGPLTLDEALVHSHQVSVSVPIGG